MTYTATKPVRSVSLREAGNGRNERLGECCEDGRTGDLSEHFAKKSVQKKDLSV